MSDVILDKECRVVSETARREIGGYLTHNGILKHSKFLIAKHNGMRYVDPIVVPESYGSEILRVGRAIPLSGHMGYTKNLDSNAVHFVCEGRGGGGGAAGSSSSV